MFLGADQALCAGETTSLSESGFDFYNWSGSGLNCANCPAVTVAPPASGYVVLQAGFSNGCVNRDSVYIAVHDTFGLGGLQNF